MIPLNKFLGISHLFLYIFLQLLIFIQSFFNYSSGSSSSLRVLYVESGHFCIFRIIRKTRQLSWIPHDSVLEGISFWDAAKNQSYPLVTYRVSRYLVSREGSIACVFSSIFHIPFAECYILPDDLDFRIISGIDYANRDTLIGYIFQHISLTSFVSDRRSRSLREWFHCCD